MPENTEQFGKAIDIELDGRRYKIRLNDSRTAREFADSIPFRTLLSGNGGNHYWGSIPNRLFTLKQLETSEPRKGHVYYADHLTAIAIYFDDGGSIAPYLLYPLGDITEDLSDLRNAQSLIELNVL
jgi:hypothetical protein